ELVAISKELTTALGQLIQLPEKKSGRSPFRNVGIEPEISRDIRVIANVVEIPLNRGAKIEAMSATDPARIVVQSVAVASEARWRIASQGKEIRNLNILN